MNDTEILIICAVLIPVIFVVLFAIIKVVNENNNQGNHIEIIAEEIKKKEYDKEKFEYEIIFEYISKEDGEHHFKSYRVNTEQEAKDILNNYKQDLIEEGYILKNDNKEKYMPIESEETVNVSNKETNISSKKMLIIGLVILGLNILSVAGTYVSNGSNIISATATSIGANIFVIIGGLLCYFAYKNKK